MSGWKQCPQANNQAHITFLTLNLSSLLFFFGSELHGSAYPRWLLTTLILVTLLELCGMMCMSKDPDLHSIPVVLRQDIGCKCRIPWILNMLRAWCILKRRGVMLFWGIWQHGLRLHNEAVPLNQSEASSYLFEAQATTANGKLWCGECDTNALEQEGQSTRCS